MPAGWGATLVERLTRARRTFYGGVNVGSVNMAELMPYLHALTWFDAKFGSDRLRRAGGALYVHVLTDSDVTVGSARKALVEGRLPKSQPALWAAMQQFQRRGYLMHFHWIPRESVNLNWLADRLATLSRTAVKQITPQDQDGKPLSAYEFDELST